MSKQTTCLACYTQKDGDRRTEVSQWSDGDWIFAWTLKTSYRTKKLTRVKLSPRGMLATMRCIQSVCKHTGKPIGWEPEET